jgi:hypothetical protein
MSLSQPLWNCETKSQHLDLLRNYLRSIVCRWKYSNMIALLHFSNIPLAATRRLEDSSMIAVSHPVRIWVLCYFAVAIVVVRHLRAEPPSTSSDDTSPSLFLIPSLVQVPKNNSPRRHPNQRRTLL